jgi:hypothetical protein
VARGTELGTIIICSASNLRVQAGSGEAPIEHVGGNAGKPCGSQVFTITVRRKADRAEVLAELAALAGEDEEP